MNEHPKELVTLDFIDNVAVITLNSPENRNALSRQLVAELAAACNSAIADRTLRAALLQAEGPVFCAGADLKERSTPANSQASAGQNVNGVPDVMNLIRRSDLPFVARIQGPVRAGGMGIVAACDIAIASRNATFAVPEVKLGLVPAIISVPLSAVLTPRSRQRYFLTGEVFDADVAATIGLISEATDDLDASIERVLGHMRDAHPLASRRTKRLMAEITQLDSSTATRFAAELSLEWFATNDAQEGIRAVLENRSPAWR